ncbi:MAG: DUF6932 family protein [Thermoplasmata archaeon]
MPIPGFTADGLLPIGVHDCTLQELQSSLGFNLPRVALVLQLRQFLHNLPDHAAVLHILVDGSFVQNVPDPRDVDVVLVVESLVDGTAGQLLLRWVAQRHVDTKARLGCDAYVADPVWVEDYWSRRFGLTRDRRPKGMLRVVRGGGKPDEY